MRLIPFALLLLSAAAAAQDVPPAVPVPEAFDTLRFGAEGPRMTVPVQIAGAGPYPFIVDTGAQRTVVSRQLAATLGLVRGRDVRLTAMTGTSNVGTVMVPSLSVSRFGAERIEAPALDAAHLGAPGILGIDTLQGHAVVIDFDARTMQVSPSVRRKRRQAAARDEIVVRARNLFGQLVVTDATYRGIRVKVILDTGSPVSMGNEPLRRRVQRRAKVQDIELMSVTGDHLTAGYTQIDKVRLGDISFQNLPIAFSAAAPFKQFGLADEPAVLLGMDALRLFKRVNIDFANREVRLRLPRDFRQANVLG